MEIKVLRVKAGLSQKEFAERIGLTAQTVQKYESGERNIPVTVQKLIRYEFAPFLPEEERLFAEPGTPYEKEANQELQKCLKENDSLRNQVKELPHIKEQNNLLRRTVELLEDQVKMYKDRLSMTNGNSKTA